MASSLWRGFGYPGSMVAEPREGGALQVEVRARMKNLERICGQKAKELEEEQERWKMTLENKLRSVDGKGRKEQLRLMEEVRAGTKEMGRKSRELMEEVEKMRQAAKE